MGHSEEFFLVLSMWISNKQAMKVTEKPHFSEGSEPTAIPTTTSVAGHHLQVEAGGLWGEKKEINDKKPQPLMHQYINDKAGVQFLMSAVRNSGEKISKKFFCTAHSIKVLGQTF